MTQQIDNFAMNFQEIKRVKITPYTIIKEAERKIEALIEENLLSRYNPQKTAISRNSATLPLKLTIKQNRNNPEPIDFENKSVLDYGKGRSVDFLLIEELGGICHQYDPYYCRLDENSTIRANIPENKFDITILIYILNVVEKREREIIAETVLKLTKPNGIIIVGVRADIESIKSTWKPHQDGYITPRGTFQSFFISDENKKCEKLEQLFPNRPIRRVGTKSRNAYIIINSIIGEKS